MMSMNEASNSRDPIAILKWIAEHAELHKKCGLGLSHTALREIAEMAQDAAQRLERA